MLISSPTIPEVVFERIKSDVSDFAFNFFQDGQQFDVVSKVYKFRLKASGIQVLEKTPATNAAGRVTFTLSTADKIPLTFSEYSLALIEVLAGGGERTIVTGTLRWSVPSGKNIGLVTAPDVSVNYIAATGSLMVALGVVDFGSSSAALSAAAAAASAAHTDEIRAQVETIRNNVADSVETVNNIGISVGQDKNTVQTAAATAVSAAAKALEYRDTATSSYKDKGNWNAVTNTPALTGNATIGSDWIQGPTETGKPQSYLIDVAATTGTPAPFAGHNFAQGSLLFIGDELRQFSDGTWYLRPASNSAVRDNQSLRNKLGFSSILIPRIQQSPSYTYNTYTTQLQKNQVYFFFGKVEKKVTHVAPFIFLRSSVGTITKNVRVQVLHQRNSTFTKLLDYSIPFSALANNDDVDVISNYRLYEYPIHLSTEIILMPGDVIAVSISNADGLHPIFADTGKAASGEWNNGVGNYYRGWNPTNEAPTYSAMPTLPAVEVNPGAVHFYETSEELDRIKNLESRAGAIEASQLTATLESVIGKNLFNKSSNVITGKGIGSDGVVFNLETAGMVTIPVKEQSQIVFSGISTSLSGGRGLRFETSSGTLISLIGQAANNVAYTTPANCARVSMQLYISSAGPTATADVLQLEYGSVATSYQPYSIKTYTKSISNLAILASDLLAGAKIGDKEIGKKEDTDALALRVNALEGSSVSVSTIAVTGKNLLNKNLYVVTGKGVGPDGVIFNAASFGSIIGQPVQPLTTYVFSGLTGNAGRGLRLEAADGTLISLIAPITNNTPFTTPALCVRLSFEAWQSSNPGAVDSFQLEKGSLATTFEAFTSTLYTERANTRAIAATALLPNTKMNGSVVATQADLEALSVGTTNFEVLQPANIYVPDHQISGGFNARREPVILYLSHFIRNKIEVWLDGTKNFVIASKKIINGTNVVQDTLNVLIGGGKYLNKTLAINRVSVNTSVLATQFPKVGWIGDSITTQRSLNNVTTGAGALWAMAKEISVKNYIDNGLTGFNFLSMGKTNQGTYTVSYKGQNVSTRGYADGYGGWGVHTWLRHPIRMWVAPLGGWDLLGLSTTQGRAYAGTAADNLLMSKTCYGATVPVISVNSYNTLVAEEQITNLGAWTGAANQIAAVQAWIDSIANGTSTTATNQYFDFTKTGTNRFNISKYLADWKTLAADGVTRLTVGSTAGTKVVVNTNHDVCEPTHYILCLGENDRLATGNFVEICNDIMELANEVTTQLPSCKVGICLTDVPGAMFPERHSNYRGDMSLSHHQSKYDLYKELQTRFGTLASQVLNRKYLIPTWFTMQPLSHSNVSIQTDEGTPNSVIQIANEDDYNHPGYYANRSGGTQIYGWLAYTYTT